MVFAVLVAALGHDLCHPGHTNQFEMNSDSELSQRYNGKSVLENYHAACLMKVVVFPNDFFIWGFDNLDRSYFWKRIWRQL